VSPHCSGATNDTCPFHLSKVARVMCALLSPSLGRLPSLLVEETWSNSEFEQRTSKMRSSPLSTILTNSNSSVVWRWPNATRDVITPVTAPEGWIFLSRIVRRGLHRTRRRPTDHCMMDQAPYGSRSVVLTCRPQRTKSIFGPCVASAERGGSH
jgi:hypothetical protein